MEENIINDDSQLEGEVQAEKPIEDQIEIVKGVAKKERDRANALARENRELKKRQDEQEKQLRQLQQHFELLGSSAKEPEPEEPIVRMKASEYEIGVKQAAQKIVGGLQREIEELKAREQETVQAKETLNKQSAIYKEYMENGGLSRSDILLMNMDDSLSDPYQAIERDILPKLYQEGDEYYVMDKDGNPEVDKNGLPVTLKTKMAQYKQSVLFSTCFKNDNPNVGMGSPATAKSRGVTRGTVVQPRSAMNQGKVYISDILNDKVVFKDM